MNPSRPHHLSALRLGYIAGHYEALAAQAAEKDRPPRQYLQRLVEGEYQARPERALARRVRAARFPVLEPRDQFRWDWPKRIDALKVKNLFPARVRRAADQRDFLRRSGTRPKSLGVRFGV